MRIRRRKINAYQTKMGAAQRQVGLLANPASTHRRGCAVVVVSFAVKSGRNTPDNGNRHNKNARVKRGLQRKIKLFLLYFLPFGRVFHRVPQRRNSVAQFVGFFPILTFARFGTGRQQRLHFGGNFLRFFFLLAEHI